MKYKKIIKVVLLAFVTLSLVYLIFNNSNKTQSENVEVIKEATETTSNSLTDGYKIYYFHTTARCYTCKLIERYADEAIRSTFSKELNNGQLIWESINVEEPSNRHYVQEFKLNSKSLVLASIKGGKVSNWKNLSEIWKLARNETKYKDYVKTEIVKFME